MALRSIQWNSPLARLQASALSFSGLSLAFCLGIYALLRVEWGPEGALRWLLLALAGVIYLLLTLWRGLGENHRAGETELLPTFGPGNLLTLTRGVMLATLTGFLLAPRPTGWLAWAPGLIYTLAVLTDVLDGYLARRADHATRLGERLDISLDRWGVSVSAALAVLYGQVPVYYLAVALSSYLYNAGLWAWRRSGHATFDLQPSLRRRAFAALQMGFITVILWPVFTPPATHIVAAVFALPFLAGFLVDWLSAAGILRGGAVSLGRTFSSRFYWLPLPLRLVAFALAVIPFIRLFFAPVSLLPGFWELALGAVASLVSLSILLGFAGRAAAILGLLLLGFQQLFANLDPQQLVLAAVYTALLYLGTGPFSVWSPEIRIFHRRWGEKIRGGKK